MYYITQQRLQKRKLVQLLLNLLLCICIGGTFIVSAATTVEAPTSRATTAATTTEATKGYKAKPVLFSKIKYKKLYSKNKTSKYLKKIKTSRAKLIKAINSDNYSPKAITKMNAEKKRLKNVRKRVSSDLKVYKKWHKTYGYATKTWEYLRQKGFSNTVACAIIGNMMTEVGGHTLKLEPTLSSPCGSYYGLCQWSLRYNSGVKNASFKEQLKYLKKSMKSEFKSFGKCYKPGFTYNDFLEMKNVEKAALAFAKVYERCASFSYKARQESAKKAIKYFNKK